MKTTLIIADPVMKLLKQESARSERTMSELVEDALRQYLEKVKQAGDLPRLPTWDSGGLRVDVADREALYKILNREDALE